MNDELREKIDDVLFVHIDTTPDSDSVTGFTTDFNKLINHLVAVCQAEIERATREALVKPNDLLRSAYAISKRDGKETNWVEFRISLDEELKREHAIMYPSLTPRDKENE